MIYNIDNISYKIYTYILLLLYYIDVSNNIANKNDPLTLDIETNNNNNERQITIK
jgi:hypothetical protein